MKRNIFLILSLIFSINCLGAAGAGGNWQEKRVFWDAEIKGAEGKASGEMPVLSPEESADLVAAVADGTLVPSDQRNITVSFPDLGQDPVEAPKITLTPGQLKKLNSKIST